MGFCVKKLRSMFNKASQNGNIYELEMIEKILENPKLLTDEYYIIDNKTGYASIDRPHLKFYKKGILDAEFPKMKMYDFIYLKNKGRLDKYALNFFGRRITYRELFDHIEETAKAFQEIGVKEGDKVVISMPTTPESVYMLFALNRLGAVAVELDPRTTKEDIERTILESETSFYITMEDCCPLIDKILENNIEVKMQLHDIMFVSPTESLPFGLNILSDLKDSIQRLKGNKPEVSKNQKYVDWNSFIKNGRKQLNVNDSPYRENQVAEVIYSSGTTNTPKPIQYTNEVFTSMVRMMELGEIVYNEGEKNLDIIPLYLGFGSNNGIYGILAFGMEDILIPVPVIENLPELMKKYKPNHLLGAPIHMKVLLNFLKNNPNEMKDLSYLKSLVSGSAYLETAKQFELDDLLASRGCSIKCGPGYGQNEAGPGLSMSTNTLLEMKKIGCSGIPLSHVIISIFDPETDEELPYGQDLEGEIRYRTPSVMCGYTFGSENLNDYFFKVGKDGNVWCCSGDLGKIDNDGAIYITGRITRQIGRGGFKFSPTEIEDYIITCIPSLESCALVAKPDEIEENVPVLYYSIKPEYRENADIIRSEIIALCKTLKEYKIPAYYIEKDKLPFTKNLKADFKALEKEALTITEESIATLKKSM